MSNDRISIELGNSVKLPVLESNRVYQISEVDNSISKYLSTRQVIRLSQNDIEGMNEHSDQLMSLHVCGNHNNGTDNSDDECMCFEYFSRFNLFVPSNCYKFYGNTLNINDLDNDIIINVYNGAKLNTKIPEIDDKINREPSVRDYSFNVPSTIVYTSFVDSKYNDKIRIGSYMHKLPVLSLNLPYEYYSKQYIPENIYTYDIDKDEFFFAGMNEEEFKVLFDDICTNGIRRNLFMQISNGKIVSADNAAYLIMLIATYLKLPSIPVSLYMLNNNNESGMLISNRTSDIINKQVGIHGVDEEELDLINGLTKPYFIFVKNGYNSDILKQISTKQYIPDMNLNFKTDTDYEVLNIHMHETHTDEEKSLTDNDIKKLHEEMRIKEQEKLKEEVQEYLDSLNL